MNGRLFSANVYCLVLTLAIAFSVFATSAIAQQDMEIIPLRHRTPDQIMPALQPLVEHGGVLSGMNNQLILRASRKNRDEIKQVLSALDTPVRMLLIRVSQNRDVATMRSGAEVFGSVGNDKVRVNNQLTGVGGGAYRGSDGSTVVIRQGGTFIGGQVEEMHSVRTANSTQSVQVMEGGRAYVNVGQSIPVPMRQAVYGPGGAITTYSTVYRDIGQGFYIEPRLVNDRVTLEISPQLDTHGNEVYGGARIADGFGTVNTQRMSTTVSGRLGEWIALGGTGQQASRTQSGMLSTGSTEQHDNGSVWLYVEEIRQ